MLCRDLRSRNREGLAPDQVQRPARQLLPARFAPSQPIFFVFFTLVTGPRRSLRLKPSDTRVYEPQLRARLVLAMGLPLFR